MSKLARIGGGVLEALDIGINEWGERQPIVPSVDTEVTQTNQVFQEAGISGQKIESLSVGQLTAGVLRVDTTIQSSNYVAGTSGFYMESATGSAEFNDGVFRGALTAATIDIGGSDATSFHVDVNGNMWSGAAAYDISTNPFAVSNAGVLRAVSGTIGGATLASSTITIGSGANAITLDGTAGTISSNGAAWSMAGSGGTAGFNIIALTYAAGESLSQGNIVSVVDDTKQGSFDNNGNAQHMGENSGSTKVAVKFTPQNTLTSSSIDIVLKKIGAPTDDFTIHIQADSGGSPSGSDITNGASNALGGGSVNTYYEIQTITFSSAFTLTGGTTYWLVFQRSTAVNGSNYYSLTGALDYGGFGCKTFDTSSWNTVTNGLPYFSITLASGSPSPRIWKAKNTIQGLCNFHGIVQDTTINSGSTGNILLKGVDTHQSGMTVGASYYIGSSYGGITSSYTSIGGVIGTAISATRLTVEPQKQIQVQTAFTSGNSATNFISTGFRPKIVKITGMSNGSNAIGTTDGYITADNTNTCNYASVANGGTGTNGTSSTRCALIYFGSTKNSETLGTITDSGIIFTNTISVSSGVYLNVFIQG